jgi:hypothetical protein
LIDDKVNILEFSKFLAKVLENCINPTEKALEIWDNFVTTNDNFFDTLPMWVEKKRLHRDDICKSKNIYEVLTIFACVGLSPFCNNYR